jgi:hypothetical protein
MWRLYYGRRAVIDVVPDERWPTMWRVKLDGRLSDMANITRAKDAAMAIARKLSPKYTNTNMWDWKREAIKSRTEAA